MTGREGYPGPLLDPAGGSTRRGTAGAPDEDDEDWDDDQGTDGLIMNRWLVNEGTDGPT